MTYDEFKNKWVGINLYDCKFSGQITLLTYDSYEVSYMPNCVIKAEVFWTPKISGWKNEKQKREFYKDAKSVGVRQNKSTKNEWFKIIDINPLNR